MCPFHYITLFSVHQFWEGGIVDFSKLVWAEEFEQKELDADNMNQLADIKENYQIITIPIVKNNACKKFEAYIKEKAKIYNSKTGGGKDAK